MRKVLLSIFLIIVVASIACAPAAAPAPAPSPAPAPAPAAKPIEINYVTFLPTMVPSIQIVIGFLDEVEKLLDGRVKFVNRGGPEAIPPFDQGMAVQQGSVDLSYTPVGYYAGLVSAPGIMFCSQTTAIQDRQTGAYEFCRKIHEDVGLTYLTRWPGPVGAYYQLMLSVDVAKPQDLAGLTVTGGSIWEPLAQGLGMEPVGIPIPEFYSAMERGVVKVAATAPDNFASMKFWEVAGYTIYPPFGSVGTALVMNPDKWNSIPPDLQADMIDAIFEVLPTILAQSVENHAAVRKTIADNGVKSITFTGADADWYLKQIYDAVAAYYIEKSPTDAAKLLDLWTKK